MTWQVLTGDCIDQMRTLEDCSIDAVVCDPPYGIGFMGHEWDQPGAEHGPVGPGRGELQGGKKRVSQPNTAVSFGGPPHPAMEAGRYDLSLTANQRFQAWCEAWSRECLRVLKPGGHLLASCGSRTYQRMACGIEDAGFEIRDSIMWLYGSGFPKSLDVSKAIDKAERGVPQGGADPTSPNHGGYRTTKTEGKRWDGDSGQSYGAGGSRFLAGGMESGSDTVAVESGAAGVAGRARAWDGWGTALKPAHEPIVVARKPLIGTVAANVLEHGTGGINVDACRIESGDDHREKCESVVGLDSDRNGNAYGEWNGEREPSWSPDGRWPANVVLDQEAAAELDAQTGELGKSSGGSGAASRATALNGAVYGKYAGSTLGQNAGGLGDSGGASRFFYCAKTSRAERNAGLDGLPVSIERLTTTPTATIAKGRSGGKQVDDREYSPAPNANAHPTVKPINLMRWLVRLVTPPGGVVLDPFTGSGSTGCAAVLEGFDFIGCEREPEYVAIAEARIAFWAQYVGREIDDVLGLVGVSERERKLAEGAGQMGLELG